MKTTLKIFLAISLLGSIALADGNQGSGGRMTTEPVGTKDQTVAVRVVMSVISQYLGLNF